jgi:hypothetical protein
MRVFLEYGLESLDEVIGNTVRRVTRSTLINPNAMGGAAQKLKAAANKLQIRSLIPIQFAQLNIQSLGHHPFKCIRRLEIEIGARWR